MTTLPVKKTFHLVRHGRGAKAVVAGVEPALPPRRVPRVARLMALAIRFERLIRESAVRTPNGTSSGAGSLLQFDTLDRLVATNVNAGSDESRV